MGAMSASTCTYLVCFFLIQIDGFMPVALKSSVIARHIGAQLLIPPERRLGIQRYLLLHVCLHSVNFQQATSLHVLTGLNGMEQCCKRQVMGRSSQ